MKWILVLLIFVNGFAWAQRAKDPDHLTTVYKLAPSIYDVKSMGNWKKGREAGQIRLVIARTHKRDEVYLQWVKWDENGPVDVKSTVLVTEIQDAANFKTTFIRRETIDGQRQIVLGLENHYDKMHSMIAIEVLDVGRYQSRFLEK